MPVECPKCGHINEDSAEVCTSCSQDLNIPVIATSGLDLVDEGRGVVSARRCPYHPEANVRLDGNRLVCSKCGYDLGGLDIEQSVIVATGQELDDDDDEDDDEDKERIAYLEVEGGQEIFFRGAYTTKVPFKGNSILVGRRDVMASHYPDIDLMMYRKLDPAISRRHLRLFREEGKYFIEDLCNNNATFLNDYANKLNHERRELHHGDRIFVSMSLALLFRIQE